MGAWGEAFFDADTTLDAICSVREGVILNSDLRRAMMALLEQKIKVDGDTDEKDIIEAFIAANKTYINTNFTSIKQFNSIFFAPIAKGKLEDVRDDEITDLFDEILIEPVGKWVKIEEATQKEIINLTIRAQYGSKKLINAIIEEALDWEDLAPIYENLSSGVEKRIYKTSKTIVGSKDITAVSEDTALSAILLAKMLAIFRVSMLDYLPHYFFKALVCSVDYLLLGEGNNYNDKKRRITILSQEVMPLILDNLKNVDNYKFLKEHIVKVQSGEQKQIDFYYKAFYKPIQESGIYQKQQLEEKISLGGSTSSHVIKL